MGGTTWIHADHSIVNEHAELVDNTVRRKNGFFMEVIQIPDNLSSVRCGLYGPTEGDEPVPEEEVTYTVRNNRPCASRIVDRPFRPARYIVVIGVGDDGEVTIFTAYGSIKGAVALREPGDQSLNSWKEVQEARAFWKDHALCAE